MKKWLKKCLALIAAIGMIIAAGLPALAGGALGRIYEELSPGHYDITGVTLGVPSTSEYYGVACSLYGPDVAADGTIHMVEGGTYNFTFQQNYNPSDTWSPYGVQLNTQAWLQQLTGSFSQQIPIDGASTFGFQSVLRNWVVTINYSDVTLLDTDSDFIKWDEYSVDIPSLNLSGKITIEITTIIDGIYTIPELAIDPSLHHLTDDELSQIESSLRAAQEKVNSNSTDGITYFTSPKEFTARIVLDGEIIRFDGDPEMESITICNLIEGTHSYDTEFDGQTYSTLIKADPWPSGQSNQTAFSIDCALYAQIYSWTVKMRAPLGGMGDDSYEDVDHSGGPFNPGPEEPISDPAKAVLITAGTAATALFGSILVSVVGDSLASTASASVFGAPAIGGDDEDGSETSGLQKEGTKTPDALKKDAKANPSVAEAEASKTTDLSEKSAEKSELSRKNADMPELSEKDADTPDLPDETTDTPDLPEEDSPEVSMALYSPDENLLNVKGGAADITIQIEGGEGYTWNYIPVIDCPGASKAIIPTVTGRSHLATLVLGMTGAKQEERCIEVNVHLIAWTTTPDGKVLKTSESMELNLYERGIEAQREKDGTITVTAYCDTTLKGYADIRQLSADEYTMDTAPDGTVHIQAKDADLGFTVLKPETEEK